MPQDLPGFYYDPEKNRYFPIKGPIPGTSRKQTTPKKITDSPNTQVSKKTKKDARISKLVHLRELYGSVVDFSHGKVSFQEECRKNMATKPKIWKYQGLEKDADCSLSLMNITVETPEGQRPTDALIAGGMNGSLSLFDVGGVGQKFSHGVMSTAESIWPERDEPNSYQSFKDIWKFNGATLIMSSSVSSISTPRKEYFGTDSDSLAPQRALITTFGSELSGGTLNVLNLADPVDLDSNIAANAAIGRILDPISLNCTVWEADTSPCGRKAVVGTNMGAKMVDWESGVSSVICSCKSDVLSVQLIQSGNIALCGLRNGTIVTVDARQQQRQLARHRIPYSSDNSNRRTQKKTKPHFMLRGDAQPSCTVYMPSSICCLAPLRSYDQYFLASSMDGSVLSQLLVSTVRDAFFADKILSRVLECWGSLEIFLSDRMLIKLYDHRLTKRGPVQSYEGQVNSHSRIQLAADASERFLMSGGEDCKVRVWSIKSGKMLFEEKLSSSIPMTVCWQGNAETICKRQSSEEWWDAQTHGCDAWLGSSEGLFRMQFCL